MTERQWDAKLKIRTVGRDASCEDNYHHAYEPTPYTVLERLADSGYLDERSVVVDYGCGKGRVGFFLNHRLGCRCIGIEYNQDMYQAALDNCQRYPRRNVCQIIHQAAEEYAVEDADSFYFFNPFSAELLKSVLGRVKDSYYARPRRLQLFFYYPSPEYVAYLMTEPELLFVDEIDCADLFEGANSRERILVFELGW